MDAIIILSIAIIIGVIGWIALVGWFEQDEKELDERALWLERLDEIRRTYH